MRPVLLASMLAMALVACGDDGDGAVGGGTVAPVTDPTASGSEPSTTPTTPPLTATSLPPGSRPAPASPPPGTLAPGVAEAPQVQAAVADLAEREGVDPGDVEVVDVREVTWSDGSLGCPQPGMAYTQALVNGQLVVLAIGDEQFEYHSGPNRPLFYCADPRPPVEGGSGAGDT